MGIFQSNKFTAKHLFTYAKFTDFFNNVNAYAVEFTRNRSVQEESQPELNFSSG